MTDETREEAGSDESPRGGFRLWMLVPALGALSLIAAFFVQLNEEGRENLPSTLIGRMAPPTDLPPLREADQSGLTSADLTAPGVKLVNIWASWCVPCRVEHPMLERLAGQGVTIHAINYKDRPKDARAFLEELGDPFARIGADAKGRAGIEWGVYGVPETFVLDGEGRIVYKHIGPIQNDDIERKIMPAIEKAGG